MRALWLFGWWVAAKVKAIRERPAPALSVSRAMDLESITGGPVPRAGGRLKYEPPTLTRIANVNALVGQVAGSAPRPAAGQQLPPGFGPLS